MSIKTNAKLFGLQQNIIEALKEGKLNEKMDVLKLQAAELGLNDQNLTEIIEDVKKSLQEQEQVLVIGKNNKKLISTISIGLIIIEWLVGLVVGGVSLGNIFLILIVNILSVLIVVFIISAIINKKIT